MTERTIYEVARGATHTRTLDAPSGDIADYAIDVDVRKLPGGRNSYTPDAAVAASYTTSGNFADWDLTLPATATASLKPGIYVADARLTDGDLVIITEQWLLEVHERVSQS